MELKRLSYREIYKLDPIKENLQFTNSKNNFFSKVEDNKYILYSYSTFWPILVIDHSNKIIFLNTQRYSRTTTKHTRIAKSLIFNKFENYEIYSTNKNEVYKQSIFK